MWVDGAVTQKYDSMFRQLLNVLAIFGGSQVVQSGSPVYMGINNNSQKSASYE